MEEQAAAQPKQRSWFRRHKGWTIFGGLVGLFIISSAIAAPSTPKETPNPVPVKQQVPAQQTKSVTERKTIPFDSQQVDDATLAKGTTKITQPGVNGKRTIVYQVITQGTKEISRKETSNTVSLAPVPQITANGIKVAVTAQVKAAPVKKTVAQSSNCDPNYSGACVPIASDVDCAGGSGNGPAYVQGPVYVVGTDIYHLDANGDGVACQ